MYFFQGEFTGEVCSLFIYQKSWDVAAATWEIAKTNVPWDNPGGDCKRDFITVVPFTDTNSWEEFDATEIVRYSISNPDSNYGLFLKTGLGNIERRYYSSDYSVDSLRPKLTITTSTAITNDLATKVLNNFITMTITPESIKFFIPFRGNYEVSLFDIKGRNRVSFSGYNKKWHEVPALTLSEGLYVLSVKNNDRTACRKFLFVN